nr:hypothetical protein GCM10017611_76410 [Rhodococcus wratislaviensis]
MTHTPEPHPRRKQLDGAPAFVYGQVRQRGQRQCHAKSSFIERREPEPCHYRALLCLAPNIAVPVELRTRGSDGRSCLQWNATV